MIGFTLIYSDSVRKTLKRLPKDRQIEIVKKLDFALNKPNASRYRKNERLRKYV
jgi:mRNA-degrading endonuclease RelE of RelBE toxin-antitoxin system